jgi:hypothetical protein
MSTGYRKERRCGGASFDKMVLLVGEEELQKLDMSSLTWWPYITSVRGA